MSQTSSRQITISLDELVRCLDPLIRRVVQEELAKADLTAVFHLDPDMPLYKDLKEILERKLQEKTELYSHQEVWDG